jgi:N-methylhydantoinase A/oxoprolinase/acetone carboxylase beta subunit
MGRLNPDFFLGGEIKIDRTASEQVLKNKIAGHFHWEVIEAAVAMYEISKANMAQLMREMTVNQGFDPRDFKIMSFGGAGSLYAADIARELGALEVIIPPNAGIFSAVGCLIADAKFDYVKSHYTFLESIDIETIKKLFSQMRELAEKDLDSFSSKEVELKYMLDLRYVGEAFEITVPLRIHDINVDIAKQKIKESADVFHKEHKRLYTFDRPGEPIEVISLRLQAVAYNTKPEFAKLSIQGRASDALKGERDVYFDVYKAFKKTPIYDRMKLGTGSIIVGPAIIEEIETSTVIFPEQKAEVDEIGNIRIAIFM